MDAHKLLSIGTRFVVLDFNSLMKENVVYVLGCQMNLLLVGSLVNKGHYFLFEKNEVFVLDFHIKITRRGHRDKKWSFKRNHSFHN